LKKKLFAFVLIIFVIFFFFNQNLNSDEFDEWTIKFNQILKKHVVPGSLKGTSFGI